MHLLIFFFFSNLVQLMITSLSLCSQIVFPLKRVFAFNKPLYMFSLLDYSALIIGIGRGHTLLNFNTLLNNIKFSGLSGL